MTDPARLNNAYFARVDLAEAGWLVVGLDPSPTTFVPCNTVEHEDADFPKLPCIFRLMQRRGPSIYVCRECVFKLHEHIGDERFEEIVESARESLEPDGQGARA